MARFDKDECGAPSDIGTTVLSTPFSYPDIITVIASTFLCFVNDPDRCVSFAPIPPLFCFCSSVLITDIK